MEEAWLANCFGAMIVWKTPLPGAKGRREKLHPLNQISKGPVMAAVRTKPWGFVLRGSRRQPFVGRGLQMTQRSAVNPHDLPGEKLRCIRSQVNRRPGDLSRLS